MLAYPWLWAIAFIIAIFLNAKRIERHNAKAEAQAKRGKGATKKAEVVDTEF